MQPAISLSFEARLQEGTCQAGVGTPIQTFVPSPFLHTLSKSPITHCWLVFQTSPCSIKRFLKAQKLHLSNESSGPYAVGYCSPIPRQHSYKPQSVSLRSLLPATCGLLLFSLIPTSTNTTQPTQLTSDTIYYRAKDYFFHLVFLLTMFGAKVSIMQRWKQTTFIELLLCERCYSKHFM